MNADQNKEAAREFLEATFLRDADRVNAVLSDDVKYMVCGKHTRFQRIWTKAEWGRYLKAPSPFEDGLALTVHAVTAEDDRVSVEAESYGIIRESGRIYNNKYHFLFEITDGKIVAIREYMDTQHVTDALPPAPV